MGLRAGRLPLPDPAPLCKAPQLVSLATAAGTVKSPLFQVSKRGHCWRQCLPVCPHGIACQAALARGIAPARQPAQRSSQRTSGARVPLADHMCADCHPCNEEGGQHCLHLARLV